jgi:hypothetical protein
MPKITKASLAWDGLLANLCRAIMAWNPSAFSKEAEYRDSLAAYLRE